MADYYDLFVELSITRIKGLYDLIDYGQIKKTAIIGAMVANGQLKQFPNKNHCLMIFMDILRIRQIEKHMLNRS